MEKTASELVRFALDEAGFAEDSVEAAAAMKGGQAMRKPYNAAMAGFNARKKLPEQKQQTMTPEELADAIAHPQAEQPKAQEKPQENNGKHGEVDPEYYDRAFKFAAAQQEQPQNSGQKPQASATPKTGDTSAQMTPQDWKAHVDKHHKGKEPEPGHCKYLDDTGKPPVQGATAKADAGAANEANVEDLQGQSGNQQGQTPEQQNANAVLNQMGASAPTPEMQATYQNAQTKLNQPTPMKVDGVQGMNGLVVYPTNPQDAEACGALVKGAEAGSETAKAVLANIQQQGASGAIQGVPQQTNPETPPVDAHAEWEKLLPTDPKAKLAVVEQEELSRVTNLRKQIEQLASEGKDTSKLEARIEESKQKVLAARAEAEGRDLEQEAAQKAQQEAEAAKPKEMTPEEYAAEAERYSPTTSKGMRELADKRYVDSMRMLEAMRKNAEESGKILKDYYERRDAIDAQYKRDKENAEMVAAKETEAEKQQAEQPQEQTSEQTNAAKNDPYSDIEGAQSGAFDDLKANIEKAVRTAKEIPWKGGDLKDKYQQRVNEWKEYLTAIARSDSSSAAEKAIAERGLERIRQAEGSGEADKPIDANATGNTTENAESSANEGETQEAGEPNAQEGNGEQPSTPPLYDFFKDILESNQDYISQEEADYLNQLGEMYEQEKNANVRNDIITNYALCVDGIVNRKKAEEAQQRATEQNKPAAAGLMGGIKRFFGRIGERIKANPKQPAAQGLMVAKNGKVITKEYAESVGIAVGWDKALRGIGYVKDKAGNWVAGGAKYLCRGPRNFTYQRLGSDSIIQRPETDGVQENIDVKRMNLENCLADFGINAKVKNVRVGSAQTTFEMEVAPGTNIATIGKYKQTMMGALKSKTIGVQTPIPGTNLVGITIENQQNGTIPFSSGYNSPEWQNAIKDGKTKLPMMYGRDEFGRVVVKSLQKIGHMIVGGGTNSGKSSFMKMLEAGFMSAMTPNEVRFVHMNPVSGDVTPMSGSPYLAIPNASTPEECAFASEWLFKEMQNRIDVMNRDAGTADFEEYNERVSADKKLPYIVVFADEYGNQMSWRDSSDKNIKACGKKIELNMTQMAARARHAGIHIIVGVQRPDVKSVNGTMKENMQGRVAFRMPSGTDYGTIMDKKDLRPLEESAQGTCYFRDGAGNIVSGQSVYAKGDQIQRLIDDNLKQAGIE